MGLFGWLFEESDVHTIPLIPGPRILQLLVIFIGMIVFASSFCIVYILTLPFKLARFFNNGACNVSDLYTPLSCDTWIVEKTTILLLVIIGLPFVIIWISLSIIKMIPSCFK